MTDQLRFLPEPGIDPAGLPLSELRPPFLTVNRSAIEHNAAEMARWCRAQDVLIAPHGKTTMSPWLWQLQLDQGAWGITVATEQQLVTAYRLGVRRVVLANNLVRPAALRWLAEVLADDAGFGFVCWVDTVAVVEQMARVLGEVVRPVPVLVELGMEQGRTGARGLPEALAVAEAVGRTPSLSLAGVAGYEGLVHGEDGLEQARSYLRDVATLAKTVLPLVSGPAVISAGGSAYFDVVAEELGELRDERTELLLRSGAYITHDDGAYTGWTPRHRGAAEDPSQPDFQPALRVWATVISQPEPGLVLLDAGRRDLPDDSGMPMSRGVVQVGADGSWGELKPYAGEVTELNDHHCFVRCEPGTEPAVGDVVSLGISHPCTALDRWRGLVVIPSAEDLVVDRVELTYF
ncbi:alanine racemase [Parenemella sanctibonifatiensis]|uniref:Amino acid deaminase n=1 Tax=Parenemella sanctibonifatiensis TaxID=2016505 RepID=A0A255EKW4_9ACTN|nr:alanine racemase [Parenemella sanctibonifatiensis]OYN91621.1 amino acid deaminase [Parenemella sanctibonifatiensis]